MSTLFDLDDMPPPRPIANCAECGSEFPRANDIGRPQRFCSADCRIESKRRQVRDWGKSRRAPVRIEYATCRHCRRVFEIPPRPGRLPHFCSPACKQASFRPPLAAPGGPDLLDVLTQTTERKSHG